jgi:short-subunit dehydrogenase
MTHVVLVGATDGIGRALAAEYVSRGWRVCVVGRDETKVDGVVRSLRDDRPGATVEGAVCDVLRTEDCRGVFDDVVRRMGQVDLLVYCAGAMPPEETFDDRRRAAAAAAGVNFVGAVRWLELGAEYLGSLGRGRVAAIGSVAGERGRKGHPVYGATKAALHAYLEGLRHRLHGGGVGVTTIVPGWVRTRMLDEATAASPLAVSAEDAAKIIADGLDRGRDHFFVPRRWALVSLVLRAMPRFLYKRFAPP